MSRWRELRMLLSWPLLSVMLLLVLVLTSAVAVIASTHQTRVQYARLQDLEDQKALLQTEWGQLLLEESTWSAPSRIERLATERLEMHVPDISEIEVIRP